MLLAENTLRSTNTRNTEPDTDSASPFFSFQKHTCRLDVFILYGKEVSQFQKSPYLHEGHFFWEGLWNFPGNKCMYRYSHIENTNLSIFFATNLKVLS